MTSKRNREFTVNFLREKNGMPKLTRKQMKERGII
jgi:hypothetical protein